MATMERPKIALLHDYLNQWGGAERVLLVLSEIFPDAPIYTLLYDEEKTLGKFKNRVKQTSFIDTRFTRRHHRSFIPTFPLLSGNFKVKDYDFVISSSAGYAKGFNVGNAFHISYCHTPLRYAWESGYLKFSILKPLIWCLQNWDYKAGQKPDILIANSGFIAQKIKKCYGRKAEVIYPPVDTAKFYFDKNIPQGNHFLMAGRLLHYKRFDLGVRAFNRLKMPLVIVGDGPEFKNLRKIADPEFIKFKSFVGDDELKKLYNEAKALIFPQVEDFGLVAAEAQTCGLPVIAFRKGGATEIIEEGVTGFFFDNQSSEAVIESVNKCKKMRFNRSEIARKALRFSKENFIKGIINAIPDEIRP